MQPTCGRCAVAGLPCNYATPPRRVDGQAFDQLGNHVEELKERMQKMQNELAMIKSNLHPFPGGSGGSTISGGSVSFPATSGAIDDDRILSLRGTTPLGSGSLMVDQLAMAKENGTMTMSEPQQPVTWKLSLSPSGLRIDTNIASVADLYRILLNGISQLNINRESAANLFSTDSIRGDNSKPRQHRTWGRYAQSRAKTLESGDMVSGNDGMAGQSQNSGEGRLWEVDDNEARRILQEHKPADDTIPQRTLDHLMHTCYHKCFLAYQIVDKEAFMQQYASEPGLDPLLANSVSAWLSKHGCIYHNVCPDKDPSSMGEYYFKNARQLLKKCFDISSATTVHALLNLYMYQLSSERSSLAYLYIGLAIRMAQDLKFHKKEHMPADEKQRETNKRLWWSAYWLDLCAALESNRPTMVDDKDCDLDYPTKLDFEDEETGYRIDFCVHSIKLMKIRKSITKHLPSEQSGQSLLSAISRLENALTTWMNELPQSLRFEAEDVFQKTDSFRDDACLILNIQYQTTWIMLHKFFLPKQNQTATPVALLSLNICTKSANFITKMLDIYSKNLPWCQFFYALDGVIASVSIHQSNATSNEKEVAYLAQRNLILTANILKGSPLIYMDKVNEIIESIETFLKNNNLPTDLESIPRVNEELISQQSICSVFHPSSLENQNRPMNASGTAVNAADSRTGTVSPANMAANLNQPTIPSQSPQTDCRPVTHTPMVPSNTLSPHQHQILTNATAMSTSPQVPFSEQGQPRQRPHPTLPTQQVPNNMGYPAFSAATSSSMMGGTNVFFNDATLMGFAGAAGNGMDQLLFRNLNFTMDQSMGCGETLGQQDVFGSLGNAMLGDPAYAPPTQPQNAFPFAAAVGQDLFSHQQQETPQRQGGNSNNGALANNLFDHTALFGFQGDGSGHAPFSLNDPTSTTGNAMGGAGAFDPTALFGSMDPAAMNALLYGPGNNNPGIPMSFPPQQPHPHSIPASSSSSSSQQAELAAAMYAAATRKRPHREWDETA